jgi:hypothetical protein
MEYQKKYDAGDLEVDSENELEQEGGCDASIRDDGEQREETSKASSTTTSDRVPRPSRRRRPNKKYTSSLLCGEEEEVEEVEEVTSEVEELEEELRCVHLYQPSARYSKYPCDHYFIRSGLLAKQCGQEKKATTIKVLPPSSTV